MLLIKLDENIPVDAADIVRAAGHDCHTIYDEALAGASDSTVAAACAQENRVLITLDLDFSDVRAYPPGTHPGIVVLRPRAPDRDSTLALLERVLSLLITEAVHGCLWIAETDRVRIRAPQDAG